MSKSDIQIATWENHLAKIIEQTNSNIQYLNQSKKHDLPPPPPPPRTIGPMQISQATLHSVASQPEYGTSRRGSISRPLGKDIEAELVKKISQSVKRTVDKSISEKNTASETRVDRIHDQLQDLLDENSKQKKHLGNLARSIASQDRLSKRLKDEWEKQRMMLQKLEEATTKDLGWKESVSIDMKLLKDQQVQDLSVRVTSHELRTALETISTKTMIAIDRVASMSKQSFESEISVLKHEIKSLKEENGILQRELRQSNDQIAKLDENHLSCIIQSALTGHMRTLEDSVLSSLRPMMEKEVRVQNEKRAVDFASSLKKEHSGLQRIITDTVEAHGRAENKEMTRRIDTLGSNLTKNIQALVEQEVKKSSLHLETLVQQNQPCATMDMDDVKESTALAVEEVFRQSETAITTIKERLDRVESDYKQLEVRDKNDNVQKCIQTFSNRIDDIQNQMRRLMEKQEHLEEDIVRQINENRSCDQSILLKVVESLKQDVTTSMEKLNHLYSEIHELKANRENENMDGTKLFSKLTKEMQDYKISLGELVEKVEHLELAPKSHVSGLTDIAACVGKVNSTRESLQNDLSRLEKEFTDLQESVISNNNLTSERIDILTKQLKESIVTSENDLKVLDQSPNAGVELTQQANQMNEVLKRNASLHADENVPSEAKQQSEDPICNASSHFSEQMEETSFQAQETFSCGSTVPGNLDRNKIFCVETISSPQKCEESLSSFEEESVYSFESESDE
ncbi:hypothetical protein CTEN210_02214 [Chaetoceros tenuissimus]|uniref:Uncharacterized protein n=1 Tax=Chaetoceros tenuissimus TaxID=426638 RepID=A0AAD3H0E5_9STRA|nr:hypothetical protein CTEN210_02214 [Chaetoceros tenuissimus]